MQDEYNIGRTSPMARLSFLYDEKDWHLEPGQIIFLDANPINMPQIVLISVLLKLMKLSEMIRASQKLGLEVLQVQFSKEKASKPDHVLHKVDVQNIIG
jgi:hypothetical protein